MAYDNKNRGTLGVNKRKTQDTHPPYAGQLNVDGKEYWLSAFVNVNKETQEKFFSITVKAKTPKPAAKPPASAPDDDSDSIPF